MVSDSALKRVLAALGHEPKSQRSIYEQANLTKDHCKKCLDVLIELGLAEQIEVNKPSGISHGWQQYGYRRI